MKEAAIPHDPLRWIAWFLAVAALFFLFAVFPYTYSHLNHPVSVAQAAWWMWNAFPEFTHGMLVPPIAAALVWLKREELATLPVEGSWWGFAALCASMGAYLIGYLADVQYVGFFSINLLVAGLILWFLGKAWMRALLFPWLFLAFMWPMPFLDNMVAFPLRMIMSQSSHVLLNLLGIANTRIGTAVVSAADPARGLGEGDRFAIDVADPCSGIHSLFALLMISALYGYFSMRHTWQKWSLFLMAIPMAIMGNMARIILLTFGTLLFGAPFAIGALDQPTFFHMAAGYFVFAVAIGGMVGAAWLLERTSSFVAHVRRPAASPSREG